MARQHAKLSQAQLAEKLGISRGAVANWESAEDAHPAASRLVKLAVLTEVAAEWLITGRGRMTYQSDQSDIQAVEGELVYDPIELQLLDTFRSNSAHVRSLILQMAESHSPATRRLHKIKRC